MDIALLQILAATAAGAIYQNVDNFAFAAAYRIKNVVISWRANIVIAIFSGAASGGAVALGSLLEEKAQNFVGVVLKGVSCGILIVIGVWILGVYVRSNLFPRLGDSASDDDAEKLIEKIDVHDEPSDMSSREAVVAAIALAADNLGPSFLGGFCGTHGANPALPGILLAALTCLFSVFAVTQGQAIGRMQYLALRRTAPGFVSGLMVIGIALLVLVDDSNPLNPENWLIGRFTQG